MTVGTRSVLFGAHAFWLHPIFVTVAWIRLFAFPWDPRIWIAIAIHDWGYVGKSRMDDADGETHVELGAGIMTALFGEEWGRFCRYHSRCYAARDGVEPSRLCYADKLATAITPAWIYLPMAKATGEIHEYMWQSTPAGGEKRKYADCGLRTGTPEEWFEDLRAFLLSWVEDSIKNPSGTTVTRPDTYEHHRDEAQVENSSPSLKAEGAIAGAEVDPIAVEAYRLLRERFAPLARFAGPLLAGSYSRGDMKGTFYVTQLRQWLCVPETAGAFLPEDAILSDDAVAGSTNLFDVARNLILAARLAFDLYLEHLERIKSRSAFVADLGVYLTDDVALVVDAIALRGRGRSETYGEEQENA